MKKSYLPGIMRAGILWLSLTSAAEAALVTAYSNFAADGTYAGFGNWVGYNSSLDDYSRLNGSVFVPTVSGSVVSIETGMFGAAAGAITLSLHSDLGNGDMSVPPLWSQTYSNQIATNIQEHSVFSVDGAPEITAGTAYWLVVDTPVDGTSFFNWHKNSIGARGDLQYEYYDSSADTLDTLYFPNAVSYAMSLTVSNVPVPAAAWLFGSGLIGLAGMAARRKNA